MNQSPKERLKENLPFSAKFLLKRLLVASVGAAVRLAAASVRLKQRLLDTAVKHGLDYERAWNVTPRDRAGTQQQPPPSSFGASDFLFLTDMLAGASAKPHASAERPVRASIIIPVFNKVEYTFQCLRSLLREIDTDDCEIIVIDNASRDETAELLARFGPLVHVVHNDENRGFVDACNQGAQLARGRFLVFLNNDTLVLPGWLRHLVETAERDDAVGAVGSMLLYPTGVVQEAGGIVWRDGATHLYGWGGSSSDRRYNFAREVDYCSGASLLVRRELFEQLGGFDRRYAPAYYEDVDLCFGVRALGRKVVYQPASRLVHHEGVTAGTDTAAGTKHFQVVNRRKFYDKWRETLERENFDRATTPAERAADRRRTPFVFVFDERTPTPDRDAGSARMFHILRSLARWSRPVFIPFNRPTGTDYESLLWREGIETASLVDYARLLRERRPYAAVFSRPEVADALLEDVRRASPGVRVVFDLVDAYFVRLGREAELSGDARAREESARYRELEARLARASDLVWFASPEDRRALEREVAGRPVEIIPTIHTPHGRGLPFDERRDLLFVGNFDHRPNADGVQHFMREVFPLVREALPRVRLTIVGDTSSSPEINDYASDAVRVTGYVPDVDPFFESARVFVAPIRFGAGVKGKIGESLAYGLPVVTTPVGAEGMGIEDGTTAMIAPDARAFAAAVVRLYRDGQLWQKLSDNGYAHVREHFSPEVVERRINEPLMRLGRAGSLSGQSTQPEQSAKPILWGQGEKK